MLWLWVNSIWVAVLHWICCFNNWKRMEIFSLKWNSSPRCRHNHFQVDRLSRFTIWVDINQPVGLCGFYCVRIDMIEQPCVFETNLESFILDWFYSMEYRVFIAHSSIKHVNLWEAFAPIWWSVLIGRLRLESRMNVPKTEPFHQH